jgi:ornithine cyclodeaminase
MQARLQLEYLQSVTDCRDVLVWGRSAQKTAAYQSTMHEQGFDVAATNNADDILQSCNLIVTTTPSETAILVNAGKLHPGTHITAMGSDTRAKRELSATIMQAADVLVADSIPQCLERGEIHQALRDGAIRQDAVVELGSIICGALPGRTSDAQITIADLTGVAVQDIQITKAVLEAS